MKQIVTMLLVFGLAFSNLLTTVAEAAETDYDQNADSDFTLTHSDSTYTLTGAVSNLTVLPPEHMYLAFYDANGAAVGQAQITTYEFSYGDPDSDITMTFYGSDIVNTGVSAITADAYKVALIAEKVDGTVATKRFKVNNGDVFSFNEIPVTSVNSNGDATDTVTGSDMTAQVSDPYFVAYSAPTTIQNHTMTVTAASTAQNTLTYQWYCEGERIDGATSSSYTISERIMYNDKHNVRYYCAVSNGTDTIYTPNFRFHYVGTNEVNAQFKVSEDNTGGTFDFMYNDGTWSYGTTDEGVGAKVGSTIAASGYDLTDAVWSDGTKTFTGWRVFSYVDSGNVDGNGQPIIDTVEIGSSLLTTTDVLAYVPDNNYDPLLFIAQWDEGNTGSTALNYADATTGVYQIGYDATTETYTVSALGTNTLDLTNTGICFTLYDYSDGTWITDLNIDPNNYILSADGKTFTFTYSDLSSTDVSISAGLYKVGLSLFVQNEPVEEYRYALGDGIHVNAVTGNQSTPTTQVNVQIRGEGGTFDVTVPDDDKQVDLSEWRTDITAGTSLAENQIDVTAPVFWDTDRNFVKWQVYVWGTVSDEEGNSWEDWVTTDTLLEHAEMLVYKPTESVLFKAQWDGDDADYGSQVIYDAFGGSITFKSGENNQWETDWFEEFGWSDGTSCASQHEFTIVGDPTADDFSFECWLEFHYDGESWSLVSVDENGDYVEITTADVLAKSVPENDVKYVVKWKEISIEEYLGGNGGDDTADVNVQYIGNGGTFEITYPEGGSSVTETVQDWGFGVAVGETVSGAGFAVNDAVWPDGSREFLEWMMVGIRETGEVDENGEPVTEEVELTEEPISSEATMLEVMTDEYIAIHFIAQWSEEDASAGDDEEGGANGPEVNVQYIGAGGNFDFTRPEENSSVTETMEECGFGVPVGMTVSDAGFDVTDAFWPDDSKEFLGWMMSGLRETGEVDENGESEYEEIMLSEEPIATVDTLTYEMTDEYITIYFYAQWTEEDAGEGEEHPYWFVFNANGGNIDISYALEDGSVESGSVPYTELFMEPEESLYDILAKDGLSDVVFSPKKDFATFTGWKVYVADATEWAYVDVGETVENDDPTVELIFMGSEDGKDVYLALLNMVIYDASMTTEEVLTFKCGEKCYYAEAQYQASVVEEVLVPDSEETYVLETKKDTVEISEQVAASTNIKTAEDVEQVLKEAAFENEALSEEKAEIVYMEITLKVKRDDQTWEIVTAENFPDAGIEVTIPYPDGVDKDKYNFVITHLISSGEKVGQIETLKHEKTDAGLKVRVYSLSPFGIAYQEIDTTGNGDNSIGNNGNSSNNNSGGTGNSGSGSFAPVEGTDTGDTTSMWNLVFIMAVCLFVMTVSSRKLRRS